MYHVGMEFLDPGGRIFFYSVYFLPSGLFFMSSVGVYDDMYHVCCDPYILKFISDKPLM
uniref:Uncharacterized protein n=1 Tax=Arundo donax TaxID=35708 RepID=A0A0A9GDR6_ARUDO